MYIKVNQSISTTTRFVTIPYQCDETVTKLELTKDGTNFITATNFTQADGLFDIESWPNGTYNNCYLRATVKKQSTTPAISLATINNMTVNKGKTFNILYTSNIAAIKHEISWDGGSTFWDKTSEIVVSNSTNYKYTHEAKTDVSSYNMAIRVTDANRNTSTKTFTITFTQAATPIQLNSISNISTTKGKSFDISYSTNVPAVKHEISWDGGSTYWDKTSNITTVATNSYRYTHDAESNYDSFYMAIRVTDKNGNTSVQRFYIYLTADRVGKIKQEAIVSNVTSSNAYRTYSSFFNKVNVNNGIIIPGLKTYQVPQGMCKYGDYIYVSAYNYNKGDYSCVYVINASTRLLEKTIWLKDSYAHVGGIATNGAYLYITCTPNIGVISLSDVRSASNDAEITPKYINIKNDAGERVTCSTCFYDSATNYLWVGQSNLDAGDHAYAYAVNGASSLTYKAKIDVPAKLNGMVFEGNTIYFSCSYGRNNASSLYVCNWGGENNDFWYAPQNVIEIPPTSEGIFKQDNLMYVLFDNASKHCMESDNVPTCPVDRIYAYNLQTSSSLSLLVSNGAYLLDDFTGTSLDRSKWDYEWGYVRNGEL